MSLKTSHVAMLSEPLHERLRRQPLMGPFCKTCDAAMIEAIGYGGMDFVVLDLEHGPNDMAALGPLIRAAEGVGIAPVVRTLRLDQIGRALDLGAAAVQVPHVSEAAAVREIVQAARFAPEGRRGVCRFVRAAGYGSIDKHRYFRQANHAGVIAQVEGREGLENLPAILDEPGVDVIFLGVYDLSQSLGRVGQTDHPDVEAALRRVVQLCAERGVPVGTFVESVETAIRYRTLGVNYLCYSVDVGLLSETCRRIVSTMRPGSETRDHTRNNDGSCNPIH